MLTRWDRLKPPAVDNLVLLRSSQMADAFDVEVRVVVRKGGVGERIHSIDHLTNRSSNQSVNQSTNPSINQPTSQSSSQLTEDGEDAQAKILQDAKFLHVYLCACV